MANKGYDDRALAQGSDEALPKPQIEIIVDGNSVFKPSMKTYFVDDYNKGTHAQGAPHDTMPPPPDDTL